HAMGAMHKHVDTHRIRDLVREILLALGEDPDREGLVKTPQRVADALAFLTSGTRTDLERIINGAIFTQQTNSMVIVKNIEVYSLCEHHMLPFFGRCHIGYIPMAACSASASSRASSTCMRAGCNCRSA